MKRFLKIFGLIVIGLIVIGTFVFLYQKSQPKATVYNTLPAKAENIQRTTVVTGTLEPRNWVSIKPQISGIIAELYKEAGQTVKKGEVIARVKVVPEMSQVNAAESRVRLAQMNVKQAQADYDRAEKLYKDRLISTEELEKYQLTLRQQREEVVSASDALQIAKEGISRSMDNQSSTLIRSTIDGLILDIPIKVGNSVILANTFNEGTTIATVANMGDIIFRGTIDETEVARLNKGMRMNISVGALPEAKLHATLEFISPIASNGTQANQFEIKGALRADGITLRSGYSANAEIVLESRNGVLAIPEAAVEFEGKQAFVHVLTSAANAVPQTFERRNITTGLSDGVHIEVRSGLKAGEQVRGNARTDEENPTK